MMSRNAHGLLTVKLLALLVLAVLIGPLPVAAADSCTLSVTASGSTIGIGALAGAQQSVAQGFKINSTGVLTEFRVRQGTNTGSPTGTIKWEIRGALPGSILASGNFTSAPSSEIVVLVAGGPILSATNTYYLIFYADSQSAGNRYNFQVSAATVYADGDVSVSNNAGASWTASSVGDFDFKIITAGLCSTATPTTFVTETPTITPTASNTPSPTPNYGIEITATSGAPMKLERSATYGDVTVFIGELILMGLIFVAFAYTFWRRK